MATSAPPTSARTSSTIVRGVQAATVQEAELLRGIFFASRPQIGAVRDVRESDAGLAAEDAEWDAAFAAKTNSLARMVADVKARSARGEARPLDIQDFDG